MEFELNVEIINQLIFAMEDQNTDYLFDSESRTLVEFDLEKKKNSDRYFIVPRWDSMSGFRVMERFVSLLKNPKACESLRAVLFAGKGVFRNFKNVLEKYPEVEKQWFNFKQRELKQKIVLWYNIHRDYWGLEHISEEPEDTVDVIYQDFIFRTYNNDTDIIKIQNAKKEADEEILSFFPKTLYEAINVINMQNKNEVLILVAQTIGGDFIGYIKPEVVPSNHPVLAYITEFFIYPSWRGLGVGRELFQYCLQELVRNGYEQILIKEICIPLRFENVVFRNGFSKTPLGFFADLTTQAVFT